MDICLVISNRLLVAYILMASDLVDDLELPVRFSSTKHTHHLVFDSDDRPGQQRRREGREESWVRGKPLGKGGGGSVWLEHCLSVESQRKARAVKAIPKQSSSCQPIEYRRELEAILRFSQKRVWSLALISSLCTFS